MATVTYHYPGSPAPDGAGFLAAVEAAPRCNALTARTLARCTRNARRCVRVSDRAHQHFCGQHAEQFVALAMSARQSFAERPLDECPDIHSPAFA